VGLGLASVLGRLGREAFGLRQIGMGVLVVVLGGGLLLQAASAMVGGWAVGGPEAVPAAWVVVSSDSKGDFNVLWVGADTGSSFVAPGGDPIAVAPDGASSLRYGLTGRTGITALDTGRTITGDGADYLSQALDQILSGSTVNGGALLAPLGVRFVVAQPGDLPSGAAARFDAQVDLDPLRTSGLVIYRNAAALPPAGVLAANDTVAGIVASDDPATIQQLPPLPAAPLAAVPGGWAGVAPTAGLAVIATEFGPDWRLTSGGAESRPREAFGWSTSFDAPAGTLRVRFTAQWIRTLETIAMALLWVAALWVTRKPVGK
jgi:hypothetical protein